MENKFDKIMPFCAELGQAAGAAVSLAVKNQAALRTINIKRLQFILRREGFVL